MKHLACLKPGQKTLHISRETASNEAQSSVFFSHSAVPHRRALPVKWLTTKATLSSPGVERLLPKGEDERAVQQERAAECRFCRKKCSTHPNGASQTLEITATTQQINRFTGALVHKMRTVYSHRMLVSRKHNMSPPLKS